MEGREPKPPEDWDEGGPDTPETGSIRPKDAKDDPDAPIGGPAGQH